MSKRYNSDSPTLDESPLDNQLSHEEDVPRQPASSPIPARRRSIFSKNDAEYEPERVNTKSKRRKDKQKLGQSDPPRQVSPSSSPSAEDSLLAGTNETSSDFPDGSSNRSPPASKFGSPSSMPRRARKPEVAFTTIILAYFIAFKPPVLTWAKEYKLNYFLYDGLAGMCTGILVLSQGVGYSILAGLPPVYGLYAAIAPSIVYIFLGPNPVVVVGPAAVVSLIVGGLTEGKPNAVLIATTASFFSGLILLVLGFLKIGFLANLISKPVVVGFTSAAAIIIATSQVRYILGIQMASNDNIITFVQLMIKAFTSGKQQVNGWSVLIGIISIVFIVGLRIFKKTKLIPGPVIVVILSIIICWAAKLNEKANIRIIGTIPSGLPVPFWPVLPSDELGGVIGKVVVVTVICLVELISVSKIFAVKRGKPVNTDMELVALGTATFLGSFFKAYPPTASLSRTALNSICRAKSQLSNAVAIIVMVITLLAATKLFYYLPFPALAGIVITSVLGLIEFRSTRNIFRTQFRDFLIICAAFGFTLFLGVEYGILASVCLNIFILLWDQSKMKTKELGVLPWATPLAFFDTIHPEIPPDEQSSDPSDDFYVIKENYVDASDIPRIFMARTTDTITYINVDEFFMTTTNRAKEKILADAEKEEPEMEEELKRLRESFKKEKFKMEDKQADSSSRRPKVRINKSTEELSLLQDSSSSDDDSSHDDEMSIELKETTKANKNSLDEQPSIQKDLVITEDPGGEDLAQESRQDRLNRCVGYVIIDMIHINQIDSTVVGRIADLFMTLLANNIGLALARPRRYVLQLLIAGKIIDLIGQDFVVDSVHLAVVRCEAVLAAAKKHQLEKRLSEELKSLEVAVEEERIDMPTEE